MSSIPSGTVTFLFTDIEGSTKLAQQYPTEWETLRGRHHAVLQAAMDAQNGYVFQIIGDAFCVAFHTVKDGLNAAVNAQRKLQSEAWGETPIKVRMGLHTGSAELHGADYRGYLTMAKVQRIMSVAYGGQILLSNASVELVRGELPEHTDLLDLGQHRLKGILNPEHLWQAIVPDLQEKFPPLQSLNKIPNNLPVQLTSFVGRQKEIEEVKQELAFHRLVTLTGTGGTGKTRLSLQVAAEVLDQYPDGVWFIELASLTDADLIPFSVLDVLHFGEQAGKTPLEVLEEQLRNKKLLLILDNCEHLIEATAKLAYAILMSAAEIKILASSREALGVRGELTWHVPSLGLPNPKALPEIEQLTQYESVRLFIERALLVQPHFIVDQNNAPAIAQICSHLDGIPLAIELAAARVKSLSVDQIAKRLDDRFRLLTGGNRTALERHQTLRAAIDWSYNLLSAEEKRLLYRLSVFVGGWTLEAAEQVCVNNTNEFDVLELLSHLVDKSLVIAAGTTGDVRYPTAGSLRYHMLETTRQYAQEKLLDSEESQSLRTKHRDYFLALAERAEPHLQGGPTLLDWLNLLESEHDNLRAALTWSQAGREFEIAGRIAFALAGFWETKGYLQEGRKWLESGLGQREFLSKTTLAKILYITRRFTLKLGDTTKAEAYGQESVALFRELNDKRFLAWALRGLGGVYVDGNEKERAEPFLKEAMSLFQEVGDQWGILYLRMDSAFDAAVNDEYSHAVTTINEFQTLARELNDVASITGGQIALGVAELLKGNISTSKELFREGLALVYQFGDPFAETTCLEGLAAIANKHRQSTQAAKLLGVAQHLEEMTGMVPDQLWIRRIQEPTIASVRAQLGQAAFEAAWAKGHAMSLDDAIKYALEDIDE